MEVLSPPLEGRGVGCDLKEALWCASELETQIIISNNLNYIKNSDSDIILSELTEIRKMLHGLRKSLTTNC